MGPKSHKTVLNSLGLSLLYTNVDQLNNKFEEFKLFVAESNPDIIVLTEVNPKTNRFNVKESEFWLPNFIVYSNLHVNNNRGILVYVRENHLSSQLQLASTFEEHIAVQLKANNNKLNLVAIYRSPSSSNENNKSLLELISSVCSINSTETLLVGDFNYPNINWDNISTPLSHSSREFYFLECIKDNFLTQHVLSPTRQRGTDVPSLLDLVLSKNNLVDNVEINSPIGKSDHATINVTLNIQAISDIPSTFKLNYFKANYNAIRNNLEIADWTSIYSSSNIHESCKAFYRILDKEINSHVPITKYSKHVFSFNTNEISLVKQKHRLWTRLMEYPSINNKVRYNRIRNKVRKLSRKKRKEMELNIAKNAKKNPKAVWRYLNSKAKTNKRIDNIIDENGESHTDEQDISDMFNKFFASVYTVEATPPPHIQPVTNHQIYTVSFEEPEVLSELLLLKIDKAPGPDGLHPKFLFEIAETISKPLTFLFNLSMSSGILPTCWKLGQITPIYKKGSRYITNNYRPISLTSILSKVMEKTIRKPSLPTLKETILLYQNSLGLCLGSQLLYNS